MGIWSWMKSFYTIWKGFNLHIHKTLSESLSAKLRHFKVVQAKMGFQCLSKWTNSTSHSLLHLNLAFSSHTVCNTPKIHLFHTYKLFTEVKVCIGNPIVQTWSQNSQKDLLLRLVTHHSLNLRRVVLIILPKVKGPHESGLSEGVIPLLGFDV